MGLLGALNKMSGYSAENMNKVFDEFLPTNCPENQRLSATGNEF